MSKTQKAIVNYLNSESVELPRDELFVTITLHRLPAILVRLFPVKVAYKYPGGIGEAIQELMKKAITK